MSRFELVNEGLLAAQLLGIPEKIRTAIQTKAIREANKLVVGKLRENTPVETGALKKSFTHDIRRWKGGNVIAGLVGADNGYVGTVERNKKGKKVFKRNKNAAGNNVRRPAKYLHLVNLGTQDRQTKAGHKRGKIKELRFREKTVEELAPQIEQIINDAVVDALK